MRPFLSLLLLAAPVIAADQVPPPQPPAMGVEAPKPPAAATPAPVNAPPRMTPELMAEMREVEGQWRAIRDKANTDPAVVQLKKAADEAQKAFREKEEATMVADPNYAAVKAKREELRAKMMPQRPPMAGQPKPPEAKKLDAPAPAPAPAPVPAPAKP